jgi:hypothetical protein
MYEINGGLWLAKDGCYRYIYSLKRASALLVCVCVCASVYIQRAAHIVALSQLCSSILSFVRGWTGVVSSGLSLLSSSSTALISRLHAADP